MKRVVILLVFAIFGQSRKIPPNFKTCKRGQENFNKCMTEAAEFNLHLLVRPYREVKLPGLNPYLVSSLVIGSGKRAVAVEQRFDNCSIFGFDNGDVKIFELDLEKKILKIDVTFPEVTKKCHYELNGKVLLLPINGEGNSTLVIKDVKVDGFLNFKEVKRNGKTHLHFDSYSLSLGASHVSFHFDNLFNGDKELGDAINKMLNDNWALVFEDVKDGYSEVINEIFKTTLNNFWASVSVEEAFGEE